jgi:redox-sensitive bicupin YhaK (pirin superfamily)
MKTIYYPAHERGYDDKGWLKANFTFSFGPYYHPDRMQFGVLKVLNDDIIDGGRGFDTHPHNNMEFITIPISGSLEHRDSMGNISVVNVGGVQVMSAGSGVSHSEYNYSETDSANTLKIRLFPKEKDIAPRYAQKCFLNSLELNKFTTLVSPDKNCAALWINQDAIISMGEFEAGKQVKYDVKIPGNGIYIFVIDGTAKINSTTLNKRDGLGVYDTSSVSIETEAKSRLLLIEVPML